MELTGHVDHNGVLLQSVIVQVQFPLTEYVAKCAGGTVDNDFWKAFQESGHVGRIAASDYIARKLVSSPELVQSHDGYTFVLETLDKMRLSVTNSRLRRRKKSASNSLLTPFMLERTDVWCDSDNMVQAFLRIETYPDKDAMTDESTKKEPKLEDAEFSNTLKDVTLKILKQFLFDNEPKAVNSVNHSLMTHVATAIFQDRLRHVLHEKYEAVAFVSDGSILPRKSGASNAPMASPPAVPFQAPVDSPMGKTVEVEMGPMYKHLSLPAMSTQNANTTSGTVATVSGLIVPRGVSLIVGGGYHGKSTLLRTIAAGVYNKIPGDGREFCVTVESALSVRAEDGRYVHNCNVSAFISNLPTPPGVSKPLDTTHFSSGEASGSTSQAANVSEAMEMGATAFLVDEDVSAANFMARDGRMRSLVMDESITPLLYRVNGLYSTHGISSVVVVGGVGDWLDVPHSVILMDKYVCKDATKKAMSVSKQFSHGHVQYAGRGVVHRLPWEKSGTPIPRRPAGVSGASVLGRNSTVISLLDGSDSISFHPVEHASDEMNLEDGDEETDTHVVDMSRTEQLMGKKPQLYGCGVGCLWVLEEARNHPELGIRDLLDKFDSHVKEKGFASILSSSNDEGPWKMLLEALGCAYLPRKFEVGLALTRLRGIQLEELPLEDDGSEAAARAEEERKKRELMEIWNSRRKNKLNGTN